MDSKKSNDPSPSFSIFKMFERLEIGGKKWRGVRKDGHYTVEHKNGQQE